jgi:hypothetical protein
MEASLLLKYDTAVPKKRQRAKMELLWYHRDMPKVTPVNKKVVKPPKPEKLKTIKGIAVSTDIVDAPLTLKHTLRFNTMAAYRGQNGWCCTCGHVYPLAPMEKLLGGPTAIKEWLTPYIEEHENS